ncbi:MAG TPA: RNA polymerase sigma factor [Rhizomicrobium sp.]
MFGPGEYARALAPLLGQAGGYARALLRNTPDAEDAVQQAALRGLERLATFDSDRPFKGWWFAILRNCCIDAMRKKKSWKAEPLGDDVAAQEPPASGEPDWARLDRAIARLSSAHQEILRLRYFGELRYADLAETLRIPEGTVMSRLHLARKALSALMSEDAP